jgi:hypothetical protein
MSDRDRLSRLLTAALHSPNFAVQLLHQAPASERAEVVRLWSQTSLLSAAPEQPRPGLRKCLAPQATTPSDMAVQLAAYARSIRNVG